MDHRTGEQARAARPKRSRSAWSYERRHEPLLGRRAFRRRLLNHGGLAVAVLAISLGVGTVGYRLTAGMRWVDALLNAAMILSGMGPVDALPDDGAKLFASTYAIFSGVVFLVAVGLLLAPLLHRVLHRFHLDEDDGAGADRRR